MATVFGIGFCSLSVLALNVGTWMVDPALGIWMTVGTGLAVGRAVEEF